MNTWMWRASATLRNLVAGILMLTMLAACGGGGGNGGGGETANKSPDAKAGEDITVKEGESVTLDGKASSDPDGSIKTFAWKQTNGDAVTLAAADKSVATFTAPDVEKNQTYEFELTVTDNKDKSASDTVKVTVLADVPGNEAPIVVIQFVAPVLSGNPVTLDGSESSDSDGSIVSYAWTSLDDEDLELLGFDTAAATFTAPDVDTKTDLRFRLIIVDDREESAFADVTVEIRPIGDSLPVARAGSDRAINAGASVKLDGSASSDEETSYTDLGFAWRQIAPATHQLTFDNASIAEPEATAPEEIDDVTFFEVELTVTDDLGQTDTDIVLIEVRPRVPGNTPPTADAGSDASHPEKTDIPLDGLESFDSDEGDSIGSFRWTYLGPGTVELVDDDKAVATFKAPAVLDKQDFRFELTVRDSHGVVGSDQVLITVTPLNDDPVVEINGPQSAMEGSEVTLTVTATDEDGDALAFEWFIEDIDVTQDPDAPGIARFVAPTGVNGDTSLQVTLHVTDGNGGEADANIEVLILDDTNPIADAVATPAEVNAGQSVSLNGTPSSDEEDGEVASFAWRQIIELEENPVDPMVSLSALDQPVVTFVAPDVADVTDLDFELKVIDSLGQEAVTDVSVRIIPVPNVAPTANAGDPQSVNETTPGGQQTVVTLRGLDSTDEDGSVVAYEWRQVITGEEVTVDFGTSTDIPSPRFTAPNLGPAVDQMTFTFELLVRDDDGAEDTDQVEVTVRFVNKVPVANAGPDQVVDEKDPVQLNGTGSEDSDGQTLTYSWVKVSGPNITFDDATSPNPSFIAPAVTSSQDVILHLTVRDGEGDGSLTDLDEVKVHVNNTGPVTTPDPFTFPDVVEAEPFGNVFSAEITLVGFDTATQVGVSTDSSDVGIRRVRNLSTGTFGSTVTVAPNQRVRVETSLSNAGFGSTHLFTITAGGYETIWSVAVKASGNQDPDVATFDIPDVLDLSPGESRCLAAVEPSGYDTVAPISAETTDGDATVHIMGPGCSSFMSSIAPGALFSLRVTAPGGSSFGEESEIVVRIGASENIVTARVRDAITTPDPFTIPPLNDVELGAVVESVPVQLQGHETAIEVSAQGGDIASSSNGTSFGQYAQTVSVPVNGYIRIRTTASAGFLAERTVTINAGDTSASFVVTTRPDRPTAEVHFPYGENSHTPATSITARGIARGAAGFTVANVMVGGNSANVDSATGEWQIALDLEHGENRFTVAVTDDDGNISEQAATVVAHQHVPIGGPEGLSRWTDPDGKDYLLALDNFSNQRAALIAIDRATMERKVISSPGLGSGIAWTSGAQMIVDQEANAAYLHAASQNAIIAINLLDGNRRVISGTGTSPFNRGVGAVPVSGSSNTALAIWNGPDGKRLLLAQNEPSARLVAIELTFGNRTVLASDSQNINLANPPSIGVEDLMANPRGLAMDHAGPGNEDDVVYLLDDSFSGRIIQMSLADTSDRVILSGHDGDGTGDGQFDGDFGSGEMWIGVTGMALQDSSILVGAQIGGGEVLFSVGKNNGVRNILSDIGSTYGSTFGAFPASIVVDEEEGAAYVDLTSGELGGLAVPERIVRVELSNGMRSYFVGDTDPELGQGTNNAFSGRPYRVAWDDVNGRLWVKSSIDGMPIAVTAESGYRRSLTVDAGETVFSPGTSRLMALDAAGGRMLLTGFAEGRWRLFSFPLDTSLDVPVPISVVAGPSLNPALPAPFDLVVDATGTYAYWLGLDSPAVYRINLSTGARQLVASFSGTYSEPSALAISADGQSLYVAARFLAGSGAILHLDLNRSFPIVPNSVHDFPTGTVPYAMTMLDDRTLLIVEDNTDRVMRVDLDTPGASDTLSSNSVGRGPLFGMPLTVANNPANRKTPSIARGLSPDTMFYTSYPHSAVLLLDLRSGDRVFLTKEN